MFSLESPHRGDSSEYTQFTFQVKKENQRKLSYICNYRIFSKGLKNEFETAVVNEPSVFEPLKFYCISLILTKEKQNVISVRFSSSFSRASRIYIIEDTQETT